MHDMIISGEISLGLESLDRIGSVHFIFIVRRLICPLTRGILYDPVVAADGWTYERAALLAYVPNT